MHANRKIRLGLLFGGRSCEHEVSVRSAHCIYRALDLDKYEVSLIGIAKSGEWVLSDDGKSFLDLKVVGLSGQSLVMLDCHKSGRLLVHPDVGNASDSFTSLDVIFPVLHGPYGEDGTVQGLFELANIAYVGSGVTGSSVSMDKAVAKSVFAAEGIPQAEYEVVRANSWQTRREEVVAEIEARLSYPLFVKPANLGSSVGISKASNTAELESAMDLAARFDLKLLVEEGFQNCHEIEVSVLGNDEPEVSVVGEIIPGGEFYDYNDKYIDGLSRMEIPAKLPVAVGWTVQEYAMRAFTAVDAAGLARVDFFVNRHDHDVYINEINTLPGFTPISMYPKLWEASGLNYASLLDRLIELAIERREWQNLIQVTL